MKWALLMLVGLLAFAYIKADEEDISDLDDMDLFDLDESDEELLRQLEEKNLVSVNYYKANKTRC